MFNFRLLDDFLKQNEKLTVASRLTILNNIN